ncbi:UDP-2,3-diacylglucosamine hydrolase [Arachidicoccus ginsenosidimutans]|uniref:UDP-2,3-diacylglucosamine diphosphatase n=1 Tax=Arachidicoccus sp. BS20 TaxID=1850526 RepID=UPI0007F093DD|nr:UDP-2,3-diacylglucosamine diphosphatase [Arachidicoccus sp. BS20]ANI88754.1 UDP-2,3-diacylglucosamine hydrolase [Arachidicoccus sp. BS20]
MPQIPVNKKIYFLSDFHLGAPDYEKSLLREKKIIAFLNSIKDEASEIFLMGDMFDFWYEYKKVVPKYFVRLLGKFGEISDSGVKIHFFIGNHDMWMNGYFEKELNIKTYSEPQHFEYNGKKLLIGHGDGLGPGDKGYKFLKKIFRNKFCNWLFGQLHPTWGIGLANYFSRKSREKTGDANAEWLGEDKEWLVIYCREILQKENIDYFIFGHRHYPVDLKLNEESRYINLGDWITNFTYAEFDGNDIKLKKWES